MIPLLIVCSLWVMTHGYSASDVVRDYCIHEVFQPDCDTGAIVINYAYFGRMKLGTCITRGFGMMGCQENVTDALNRECFAKGNCQVAVNNHQLFDPTTCGELRNYLEVSHKCLPVITSPKGICDEGDLLRITSPSLGYISSTTSRDTGCGSQSSPWLIESIDGKLIVVTLLDMISSGTGATSQNSICLVYAMIKEAGQQQSVTVCGGQTREGIVYESHSSAIEITIISRERQFVLKYEFAGCASMAIQNGMTLTRDRNVTTVTCDSNRQTSNFKCNGSTWSGQLPNCTVEEPGPDLDTSMHISATAKPPTADQDTRENADTQSEKGEVVSMNFESITWGMVLIVVGIITGGIVACVFIIAVVYLKRKSIECKAPILVPRPVSEAGYEVCDFDISHQTSSVFHDGYRTVPKDYTSMMNGGTMKYKPPDAWERPLPAEPSNV